MPSFTVERLHWTDLELADIAVPRGRLRITLGVGSGLARRAGDPPGRFWALGDRGPNLKVDLAVEAYGLTHLASLREHEGAKIMPRPDLGPMLAELEVTDEGVVLRRTLPLHVGGGRRLTGLPLPAGDSAEMEPAFDLSGAPLAPDAAGADTEAVVALSDGTFRVAEEYGPSILVVDADGRVTCRWLPEGHPLTEADAGCPVPGVLPAIAGSRRLNRGFEALALSPDERSLFVVFQSALTSGGADEDAPGQLVRIWRLDATTGQVEAQWLYPFDAPDTFARDVAAGEVGWDDLKVCEVVCCAPDRLLVLERLSHTAKVYAVDLPDPGPLHLVTAWELTPADARADAPVPELVKRLVFSTDAAPEVSADLEGMLLLDDRTLLLVNDNDFGVEGAPTCFWRVTVDTPL